MRVGANIRKRSDGRYEARYIKERDAQGRIVYGYCYGKSYDEAAEKKNQLLGIAPVIAVNNKAMDAEKKRAIPSVGNCELRMKWIEQLVSEGFILPTLISPHATVSPSAEIGYGTLIEPKAILGANTKVGAGCIVSAGAIIDRDALIEDGCHIGCAAKVMKNSIVKTRMVVV